MRKKLFEVLPKEGIVIFELKKTENTLEDAFIKLIDSSKSEENKTKSIPEVEQDGKENNTKVEDKSENNKKEEKK